jgi:hypothetical protein
MEERLKDAFASAFGLAQNMVNPVLAAVGSALGAVAGFVTVLALTVFHAGVRRGGPAALGGRPGQVVQTAWGEDPVVLDERAR